MTLLYVTFALQYLKYLIKIDLDEVPHELIRITYLAKKAKTKKLQISITFKIISDFIDR